MDYKVNVVTNCNRLKMPAADGNLLKSKNYYYL